MRHVVRKNKPLSGRRLKKNVNLWVRRVALDLMNDLEVKAVICSHVAASFLDSFNGYTREQRIKALEDDLDRVIS